MEIKYDFNKNKLFQNPFLRLPEPSVEDIAEMLGGKIITIHPSTDSINVFESISKLQNKQQEHNVYDSKQRG